MTTLISVSAAPGRTTKQSLMAASYFAASISAVSALLGAGYSWAKAPGAAWAIVSAILVLYPGITQSLSAAALRIAANLLGTGFGFIVGYSLGTDIPQLIVALILVIFAGELLRMDLALRTACVAAVIVMTANEHNIKLTIVERIVAVSAGCLAALAVQLVSMPLRRWIPFAAQSEVKTVPSTPPVAPRSPTETG